MTDRGAPSLDNPNHFDAIRLLMAILVVYAHAYPLSVPGAVDPLGRWTHGRLGLGGIAVLVFFAMSGYLIAASANRSPSLTAFVLRRCRRIYPGYIVALAACAFVVSPLFSGEAVDVPRRVAKFAVWAALLNAWNDTHAFADNAMPQVVNGSLWTIQQEFTCYVMLAAVAFAGGSRRRGAVLAVAVVAFALHAARCLGAIHARDFYVGVIRVLPASLLLSSSCFFAGSVAYAYRDRVRFRPTIAAACVAAIGLCARASTRYDVVQLVLPIALPYVVLTIAFARPGVAANFATRVGGDYSYGTYLYAFPIQQVVAASFGGTMRPWANFAIALPVALLCGVASWHGVEKRFVRRDRSERVATIVPAAAAASGDLRVEARAD